MDDKILRLISKACKGKTNYLVSMDEIGASILENLQKKRSNAN